LEFKKCNGEPTPVETVFDKVCLPNGSLKLNDECEDDISCG